MFASDLCFVWSQFNSTQLTQIWQQQTTKCCKVFAIRTELFFGFLPDELVGVRRLLEQLLDQGLHLGLHGLAQAQQHLCTGLAPSTAHLLMHSAFIQIVHRIWLCLSITCDLKFLTPFSRDDLVVLISRVRSWVSITLERIWQLLLGECQSGQRTITLSLLNYQHCQVLYTSSHLDSGYHPIYL